MCVATGHITARASCVPSTPCLLPVRRLVEREASSPQELTCLCPLGRRYLLDMPQLRVPGTMGRSCSGPPRDWSTRKFYEPAHCVCVHTHTAWSHSHTHTYSCTQTFEFISQLRPSLHFIPVTWVYFAQGTDTGTCTWPQRHTVTGTHGHRDTRPCQRHTAMGTHSNRDTQPQGHMATRTHTTAGTHGHRDTDSHKGAQPQRHMATGTWTLTRTYTLWVKPNS